MLPLRAPLSPSLPPSPPPLTEEGNASISASSSADCFLISALSSARVRSSPLASRAAMYASGTRASRGSYLEKCGIKRVRAYRYQTYVPSETAP